VERSAVLVASAPSLVTFLGATDPAMRYAGVRVIGRVFARRTTDAAIDPLLGDAVITALNDSDRVVKAAAMAALGAMRYDRGGQALTDLFQFYAKGPLAEASLDALAHIARPASIPVLSAALTGKKEVFQMMAIEGIARLADASRLADVQTATAATHSAAVQLAAVFAAVMLSDASPDPIGEALTQPKVRAQAKGYLVEIAPGHVAQLSGHLQDPDERVRADVADVLGLAGDPAALPMLEPLLTDRDPDVARAAEHAVARLRRR
jgi:HEAT repeat protein